MNFPPYMRAYSELMIMPLALPSVAAPLGLGANLITTSSPSACANSGKPNPIPACSVSFSSSFALTFSLRPSLDTVARGAILASSSARSSALINSICSISSFTISDIFLASFLNSGFSASAFFSTASFCGGLPYLTAFSNAYFLIFALFLIT